MKTLLFLLLLVFSTSSTFAHEPKASSMGEYSNLRYTHDSEPHFISGFSIRLYSLTNDIIGEIAMANGSEEPVSGVLSDVIYQPQQHLLVFKAKLSAGREYGPEIQADGRCSRELLEFSGKITPNAIIGTMIQKDGYNLSKKGITTKEKLKRFEKNKDLDISVEEWNRLKGTPSAW